ncbi:MAG: class I SAM-dependent methyltransferase [Deltaproteobacteria bacterium]|nr:class I SAM-dependent methyltransferase [Deltaproteobacteria bacterium]
MLPGIPEDLLALYRPLSPWESFYLRNRWRLCPYGAIEACLPREGRILDFGCGYGLLANLLVLRGPSREVVGIDLNRGRIETARRSVKGRRNLSFRFGDIQRLGPERFHAVVMTDVLHHIDDARTAALMYRIRDSLMKGGMLTVLDVDRRPRWKSAAARAIDRLLNPGQRLYYRSRAETTELLAAFGLHPEKVYPVHRGLPLSDVLYLCRKQGG